MTDAQVDEHLVHGLVLTLASGFGTGTRVGDEQEIVEPRIAPGAETDCVTRIVTEIVMGIVSQSVNEVAGED